MAPNPAKPNRFSLFLARIRQFLTRRQSARVEREIKSSGIIPSSAPAAPPGSAEPGPARPAAPLSAGAAVGTSGRLRPPARSGGGAGEPVEPTGKRRTGDGKSCALQQPAHAADFSFFQVAH